MNANGGADRSNEELLGDFKRWLELMDQSGLVSDRSIARALGVNHKLIGGSRTGSAWRDRNAVRRICFVLGEAFWRLTPAEIAAWSDAVARGERSTAFEMVEAIESGAYVWDKSADGESGDGDDAEVVDESMVGDSDADSGIVADSGVVADSGELADSGADAVDALRVDGEGDESSDADGVAAAGGIGVAGSASGVGGISAADSVVPADSMGVADSVDAADGAGAEADADGADMADAAGGSSAIDGVDADSAGADIAGDAALGDAAGDAAPSAPVASAGADGDAASDAAGDVAGDASVGAGIAEGGVAGVGDSADAADSVPDASGAAGSGAGAHSGADAADSGASAGVAGEAAADIAGDAPDAAAGVGDSAAGGAIGGGVGESAAVGIDSVVSADDGDDDVVSGDAGADSAGAAAASEDASAGDTAAPDGDAPVGDAVDGEDAVPSDVSAVGRGSVRAAGSPPPDGARVMMRGRKRGPFGIFGRRRDVIAGGVSRAGDLGSVSGVSGVSRAGGAAESGVAAGAAHSAGAGDAPGGNMGDTAASGGDAAADAAAVTDAAADVGADASADAGVGEGADMGADADADATSADWTASVGADPGILDIRRRMEQWTKKIDGDAAKAEWEAREDPEGEIAALRRAVEQADSVDVIARCSAGPVLREIPGLSLEDARTSALMKIDGWTPTGGGDKPPGLYGDAPLLFHLGVECSYADEGARAVAFAPNLAYEDEVGYSAVRLRYGLTPYDRMARYFCEDYLARPKRAGFYRHSNRLPERPYPDSDWFFGCAGLPRPGGVWMPSIAEVAAFYYMVKEMIEGFVGTAGEESEYVEHLRLLLLECQYLLFDPDYWITMHYHQEGKSIGGSTRVFERQTLADQIRITDNALARLRRRRLRRRALRFAWRALSWPARAAWRRLRGRGDAEIPEDALGEVVGESADVGLRWAERDRTRWYEPGVGALSDQGDAWLAQLPDAMAEVWGGVARPRVRSVPGPGERRYRHGKWRIPRKLS